ncbi:MAG: addiction module protein [Undibacterium sp.]|nr:addiction module protein [Opitutaceae bacterium]
MSPTLDQIVEEAQHWSDDVVAESVDRLMLARHGVKEFVFSHAWQSAAARRVAEIRSGQVQGIPGEAVSARIRQIVGR